MRLALRELRRRPGRFVVATVILTLITVLVVFLGGLLDGLIRNATGGLEAQPADLVVYAADADASFVRSRITADQRERVEQLAGVAEVGGLGVVQLGARVPGAGPRDLADVALFGVERAPAGLADLPADGEVVADTSLQHDGIEQGMTIELGPQRTPVTVVGFVDDTNYIGQGSLWGTLATWREVQNANRPDAFAGDDVVQSLVVAADGSVPPADLATAIDSALDEATETLTIGAAVDRLPGLSQQRTVFNQIIGATVAIAAIVVGLFFALLTVEKVGLFGVLKAMGARTGTLFAGLVTQALATAVAAGLIGTVLALALDALIPPGSIPFTVSVGRVVTSMIVLIVATVVGCAFSLRRIVRIDPAQAIGSTA